MLKIILVIALVVIVTGIAVLGSVLRFVIEIYRDNRSPR